MNASIAWVLRRAIRLAVATGAVALIFATTLSGEGAERLATTAYLAAIFAAVALAIGRFLPAPERESGAVSERPFPELLAFVFAVAVLLGAGVALATLPGAEAFAVVAGLALVAVVGLARSGTLAEINAALGRGGPTEALIRYAVLLGTGALAFTVLLSPDLGAIVSGIGYRLVIVAAAGLAAALIAPTRAGAFVRRCYSQSASGLDRLADAFGRERVASYAALIAVGALIGAMLLTKKEAEPLAIAAWAAALVATVAVAMECRRLRG